MRALVIKVLTVACAAIADAAATINQLLLIKLVLNVRDYYFKNLASDVNC